MQSDWKARNIIISAQAMWETLKVTNEGTNEVNRSKINTLIKEFEQFHMKKEKLLLTCRNGSHTL